MGGKFVDVVVPEVAEPLSTLVLMTGFAPTAFVTPSFPKAIAFLRPESYFVEPEHRTSFNAEMHARIAGHGGEIYVLQATWEKSAAQRALPQLGLEVDADDCRPVRANLDSELELCAVKRITVAPRS